MLPLSPLYPFTLFILGELLEKFFVKGTSNCRMLFTGDVAVAHALEEDGVNKASIAWTPEIVRGAHARPGNAVPGELGGKDSDGVRRSHFELPFLPLGFRVLVMKAPLYLL